MAIRRVKPVNAAIALLAVAVSFAIPSRGAQPPGQDRDTPTPLDEARYDLFDLDFDAAHEISSAWLVQHPDSLQALTYLAKSILDKELLKEGLLTTSAYLDTGQAYRRRHTPFPASLEKEILSLTHRADDITEKRLANDPNDQDALYWDGVIHATFAECAFLIDHSYIEAIRQGARAHRQHERLYKLNPNYTDALVIISLYNYVTGSLPWYLKVLAAIAGFHGSKSRGIEQLEEATRRGHQTRDYARLLLIGLYRREKMYDQALAVLPDLQTRYPRDFLLWREQVAIEQARGNWREAARVEDTLVEWLHTRRAGWQAMNPEQILFDAAQTHEHLGELDQALALDEEAASLPGDDPLKYRAALAGGALGERLNRPDSARRNYQLVANAVPDSDEGKAARRALERLQ